jgi:ATP-dependent HslUV protease ATP-binding subunit HslU
VSWKFEEHETAAFTADLTPRQIVEMLDRHIVGQQNAKKAVANALRNRWRRRQVASPLREEIVPKNILMLGPTGCGKTEIARRLEKLADAPFVKVEATKFTEVGFHGRDVDQIIRDLVENAILMVRQRLRREHAQAINRAVEDRIIAAMVGEHASKETAASFRRLYREGELEDREIEIDVPASPQRLQPPGNDGSVQEMVIRVDRLFRGSGKGENKRKLKVSEARPLIEEHESDRFLNNESVTREAISAVEQDGIVFIDEIDKIVSSSEYRYGADASSEGVQRDLLPIIEGSVVSTKHGNVNTDYILFICSGAFHQSKPSDMLAELQGRLPVRVELKGLSREDFYRILTEPEGNMIKQQQALLATEGVHLHFTDAAIKEIARVSEEINTNIDNIGARRLYTIIERIIEDISYEAPDQAKSEGGDPLSIVIDKEDVLSKLSDLLQKQDLSKYVL